MGVLDADQPRIIGVCEDGRSLYVRLNRLHRLSNRRSPLLRTLRSEGFWRDLVAVGDARRQPRWRRMSEYRALVHGGEMARIVDAYATGDYAPAPPVRHHVNKANGSKKVVFTFAPPDELLFKALNQAMQRPLDECLSPLCHSFRPQRGPRSAYAAVRSVADLDQLACLHLDVRDFFNSIPVESLMQRLPDVVTRDKPLYRLLEATLGDPRVISEGMVVVDTHKGVMAGAPLAPVLSNLYLRELDELFEASGVPYLRYADDIVVFAPPDDVDAHRDLIERTLLHLGLELNHGKTRVSAPGEAWDFVGFRYERGRLDVAPRTAGKLGGRVRRLARRARERADGCGFMVRRLNRRLYGVGGREADFTWAGWFFPLLTTDATLRSLDQLIQGHLRHAVTGRHEKRNFRAVPYEALRRAGYLPLVTAFHGYRAGTWRL